MDEKEKELGNSSADDMQENIDNENVILTFDNVETIKQQEVYWNE